MSDERILEELDRIEAEAGCELPELTDPTPRQRAERLLKCDDPPRGIDREICLYLAGEREGPHYSIYWDSPSCLFDWTWEGPEPPGAIGSNWQPGYSLTGLLIQHRQAVNAGFRIGSDRNPRF